MQIDVKNCQRCKCSHSKLGFAPLAFPVDDFSWYAMCPTINQPILMKVDNAPSVEAKPIRGGVFAPDPKEIDDAAEDRRANHHP